MWIKYNPGGIKVNKELVNYIENEIFPLYSKNEEGHGIKHINKVIERSLKFAKNYDVNIDMIYTIAAYHDLGHHIDRKRHEIISAQIFIEDENMKKWFSDEQRKITKEAIEDHRASLEHEPRSDYGKIISSADRTTSIDSVLQRTHSYTTKHYLDLDLYQMIERSYNYILKKYGNNGYAKNYCCDDEYE